MFIQNFFLVFGCLFLSAGFVLWTTDDFVERESEFLKSGGKFIVPCPTFEIIGM